MNHIYTNKIIKNINTNSSSSVNLVYNNNVDKNIDEDTYINNWIIDTDQLNSKNNK